MASDLIVAAVLGVFAELDVLLSGDWRGPVAINVLVVAAMVVSLVWRRSQPLIALFAVMGGVAALSLAFGSSQTWTSVFLSMVAVYSAVTNAPNPLIVAAVAAIAATVTTLRDPLIHSFGDAAWTSTLFGLTFVAGLGGRSIRARHSALKDRAEALDREEEERATAAAAEERRRIARELHDIISHSLGVLVLQAGAAEQVLDRDPAAVRELLGSIRATGQEAVAEMGTLLGLVRGEPETSREPQPSLAELDRLITKTRQAGLPVELEITGERRRLPAALELSAFRVVQEGLTNALKHSGPSPTRVALQYRDHDLEVVVTDDGIGSSAGPGARRGLAGLRERVAVFNGTLEAGPGPEGGWALRARFPVTR